MLTKKNRNSIWNSGTHKTHMNHFLSSPAQEFVPEVGLEPTYRKALDPKSSASTNFATRAYYFLRTFLLIIQIYDQKVSIHSTIAIRAFNQFESSDVSYCDVGSLVFAGFLFFCVCHTL